MRLISTKFAEEGLLNLLNAVQVEGKRPLHLLVSYRARTERSHKSIFLRHKCPKASRHKGLASTPRHWLMLEMGQGHEKPFESIRIHWTPVFRPITGEVYTNQHIQSVP